MNNEIESKDDLINQDTEKYIQMSNEITELKELAIYFYKRFSEEELWKNKLRTENDYLRLEAREYASMTYAAKKDAESFAQERDELFEKLETIRKSIPELKERLLIFAKNPDLKGYLYLVIFDFEEKLYEITNLKNKEEEKKND